MKTYEKKSVLEQYLLFHYGCENDLMPFSFGPKESLDFPIKCVTLSVDGHFKNGLDLGCAVGRSTFELSLYCEQVTGIDNSKVFIDAAEEILNKGSLRFMITEEGTKRGKRVATRPQKCHPERVQFKCQDVMNIFDEVEVYDLILAANLICRLPDPQGFLENLHKKVMDGGTLVITSPYSWLEEYTPKDHWPKMEPAEYLKNILGKHFKRINTFNLPFTIREHYRKYQWGVAEVSVWIKVS